MVFLNTNTYLDIDQILAEEERIPVTWSVDGHELGFLANHQKSGILYKQQDIKAGSKVDLPAWILRLFVLNGFLTMRRPKCLSDRVLLAIEPAPDHISLNDQSPYFYEVAHSYLNLISTKLNQTEEEDMTDEEKREEEFVQSFRNRLLKIFIHRYNNILLNAHNTIKRDDFSLFTRKLCLFERELFNIGRKGSDEYLTWKFKTLGSPQISTSSFMMEQERQSKRRA